MTHSQAYEATLSHQTIDRNVLLPLLENLLEETEVSLHGLALVAHPGTC